MQKNVAGQKWIVFAFNRTDNVPQTGDAANITANLRIDGGAANAVDDVNPTELEDGYYAFDISQAESNGELIVICPASSTGNVQVIGVPGAVYTTPPNFPDMGIESDGDLTKVNTLDGHTAQTADHTAAIADIPTVAEFNARSLVAADYTIVSDLGVVQTADHTAGITAILDDTDLIDDATSGLAKIATDVAAILDDTDLIDDGTSGLAKIATDVADILVDTGTTLDGRIPAALVGGKMNCDATAISGSTDAADKLEASAESIVLGTAQTGTLSTTEMTTNLTISANDQYNGRVLIFRSDTSTAALQGQATDITDTVTTDGKLTFTALTTAPANGDTFVIV